MNQVSQDPEDVVTKNSSQSDGVQIPMNLPGDDEDSARPAPSPWQGFQLQLLARLELRVRRVHQVLEEEPTWLSRGSLYAVDAALSGFLNEVREQSRGRRSGASGPRMGFRPDSQTPFVPSYTSTRIKTPQEVIDRIKSNRERKEMAARQAHQL